ncbi:MAG: hypothetical protein C4331_18530 [Meiothermus sp.]
MSHLRAQLQLEVSQALIQSAIAAGIAHLDLPIKILRFSLGRLHGGEVTQCELTPGHWNLGVRFSTGPAIEVSLEALEYQPETQFWKLKVEKLHFSGFSGAPLLNLAPGRVLEVVAAQANRRLPGLLGTEKGMVLELRLQPLLQKVLEEAPLRQVLKERLGLEPNPELSVQNLELLEGKLNLSVRGLV